MTYRPPSRCKLKQASAFLIFTTVLSLSACGKVDFEVANKARVSLPVLLEEARRITDRLTQAKLIKDKEPELLYENLRKAEDSNKEFGEKVRREVAGEEPDTEDNRKALVERFEEVFVKVETFKLTVSSLGDANARESYQVVLSMIDTDLGNVATALGCEDINPNCVRCSENHLHCKK